MKPPAVGSDWYCELRFPPKTELDLGAKLNCTTQSCTVRDPSTALSSSRVRDRMMGESTRDLRKLVLEFQEQP